MTSERADRAVERLLRAAGRRPNGFRGLRTTRVMRAVGMPTGTYRRVDGTWYRQDGTERPTRRGPDDRLVLRGHSGRADAAAHGLRIKRREAVVLAPGVRTTRHWLEPRASRAFLDELARLQHWLPGSLPEVSHGGRVARFGWRSGDPLHAVPPERRVDAVRTLLRAQGDANVATATVGGEDPVLVALELGHRDATHGHVFAALRADPRLAQLVGLPSSPQHGDPSSGNVIVAADGSPALIDWSPWNLGVRPFWSDAAHLVSTDGHAPLLAGAFDAELDALWRSVGLTPPDVETLRGLMAFAGVLFFATISLAVGADGRVISLTTGAAPTRLSRPWKVARAFAQLPGRA